MTVTVSSSPPMGNTGETSLQREQQLFRELSSRLIDAFLNRMFDLRPAKAARRMRYLVILFLLSLFVVSLRFYPLGLWAKFVQDIFLYTLNPAYRGIYVGNPYSNFLAFAVQVFTDPRIFQYIPVFLAPFFIALQCAALYLADVFELEHVSVARAYIWGVALSGSEETIRISQGDITEEGREKPTYLIGGPGKVIVDLDSVALFEKSDGTPHIIGPTLKEPRARATLDGFERFRHAVDIRDHYVDLRDQNSKSGSVSSRSLDGIPIEATDVRFMFSIYRDGKQPDLQHQHPYPFSNKAVEDLVYKATSRVTPGQANPSAFEFSWVFNMIGLIRSRLSAFMSEYRLTSYLASIGDPEVEKLERRKDMLVEEVQELTQSEPEDALLFPDSKISPPEFQAREKIKDLFSQFAEEFTKRAQSNGVELHWIGVGTWKVPVEIVPETKIVPEEHLEAWKISNENLYRENSEVLDRLEKAAILQKMIALIQDVPISRHQRVAGAEGEQKKAMRSLLQDYRQQLLEAAEFMRAKGEAIPPNLEEAITHINNTLYHFI